MAILGTTARIAGGFSIVLGALLFTSCGDVNINQVLSSEISGSIRQALVPIGDKCDVSAQCAAVANGTSVCEFGGGKGTCVLASCDPTFAVELDATACNWCMPTGLHQTVWDLWTGTRPSLEATVDAAATGQQHALYYAQIYMHNAWKLAAACEDLALMDEVAAVMERAFNHTTNMGNYETWVDPQGQEIITLSLSQFTAMVSEAIADIAALPAARRTTNMTNLMNHASTVMVDHQKRWIFDQSPFNFHAQGCDGLAPLHPQEQLTAAAWVKTSDGSGWVLGARGTHYTLEIQSGRVQARLVTDEPNPGAGTNYTIHTLAGQTTVADGQWHHVALTFDAVAGTLRVFVDGNQEKQMSTVGELRGGSGQVDVGGYDYQTGSCCFLSSTIDEVRIYERALSPFEVAQLAACTQTSQCNTSGLVSLWDFEDGGTDQHGPFDLESMPATPPAAVNDPSYGFLGSAQTYNGSGDCSTTHLWNGPQSHYWLLRGKAWGALTDHRDDPQFCHAIYDVDMWIVAGTLSMLAAADLEPSLVSLTQAERDALLEHVQFCITTIIDRINVTNLQDPNGYLVQGAVFDEGMWDDHPEHGYTAYTGSTFPSIPADAGAHSPTTWDLSHARRFVKVFDILRKHRDISGFSFPTANDIGQFASQYAYASFNGDLTLPLFANFASGHDGWYRVEMDGRPGFGYGPSDMSFAAPTGGFGFWKAYNRDIRDINRSLWNLVTTTDQTVIDHRNQRYGVYWDNFQRVGSMSVDMNTSLHMLMFLPSLGADPKQGSVPDPPW